MDTSINQLFVVMPSKSASSKVLVWAVGREEAKRQARIWLGMNPEKYIVIPITSPGDRVKMLITLNI